MVFGTSILFCFAKLKSSRPCPGAMCTIPVPSSLVTKSAVNKGTLNLYPKSFKGCVQIVFLSSSPFLIYQLVHWQL